MAALPALDYICNEYSVRAFAATHSQTPPLLDYVPEGSFSYSLKGDAPAFGEAVIRFIRAHHIPNVILIARWQGYKAGQSPEFHSALTKTLSALQTSVANIWIMQEVPNFSWDVPRALARAALFKKDVEKLTLPLNSYFEQTANQEREFAQAATSNVIVLNPVKFLSKGEIIRRSGGQKLIPRTAHQLKLTLALTLLRRLRATNRPILESSEPCSAVTGCLELKQNIRRRCLRGKRKS